MKKLFAVVVLAIGSLSVAGCAVEPVAPVCTANYIMGGTEYTTPVFAVKKENGQTMYKAGHPFNFRYVNKSNFTTSTCN